MAIVVHGGYWKAQYDRSLMEGLCVDLAVHGLAAWNLEYRRVGGGGGWPDTFLDVAAGVDHLAELDAGLDVSRVVAVGHSAGGQLAFWAAARPGLPEDGPGHAPRVVITGAVSQAGVLDLALGAGLVPSSTPTRALLGDPSQNYERYVLASPRERLPTRSRCESRRATRPRPTRSPTRASCGCSRTRGTSSISTLEPPPGMRRGTG